MKTKLSLIGAVILFAAITSITAAPDVNPPPVPADTSLFAAGETTLDLAGTYTLNRDKFNDVFDKNYDHGKFGVSLGLNHWFTKYVGLGADITLPAVDDVGGSVLRNVNLSAMARYPIGKFAPYVLGGGGRDIASGRYTVHGEGGIQFAFTKRVRSFLGIRYVVEEGRRDQEIVRAGVQATF
jgi:opacity protein-like surface antigen